MASILPIVQFAFPNCVNRVRRKFRATDNSIYLAEITNILSNVSQWPRQKDTTNSLSLHQKRTLFERHKPNCRLSAFRPVQRQGYSNCGEDKYVRIQLLITDYITTRRKCSIKKEKRPTHACVYAMVEAALGER